MSEWASTIVAVVIGAVLGFLGALMISASVTTEFNGIAYKVERLNQ